MKEVVSQFDFTVVDYTTTQYGYLFTVGTTGSRSKEYRFIYMPYSRYPSVLMFDFYVARSISHGYNHDLIQAIRKDMESVEGFIVFGDGKQSKAGSLHEQTEGSVTYTKTGQALELSFAADRTALIEALESSEHPVAHRPNVLKDAALDDEMTQAWRVDNDKELKIVRNLGLTRRFIQNLGKIDPSKISFKISEFGMIADYADTAGKFTKFRMDISELVDSIRADKPELNLADVYAEVERIVGRSTENEPLLESVLNYLRSTERSETIQVEKMTRRDVELLYQDLLGVKELGRQTIAQEASILGVRVIDNNDLDIGAQMSEAYLRRFQEIKYMHIEHNRPVATRIMNNARLDFMNILGKAMRDTIFIGAVTGKSIEASRDFKEQMLIAELGQAAGREIEERMSIHENILAKLKDRQYPTLLHKELRTIRDIHRGQVYMHDELAEGTRVKYRYEPVLRPSDIFWHPILAQRVIDSNPTVTESGIILAHRDIDSLTHIERSFPWAVRNNVEKLHLIEELTPAQRIFVKKMYVETERPMARRIFVVRATIDQEAQQAYRDSTEYGFVFRDLQESKRVNKFKGYVERESPLGQRIFKEALDILRKYELGERVNEVESYIEERFIEGETEAKLLLLPKVEAGADREDRFDMELLDASAADRWSGHELWLPEDFRADKEIAKPTVVHSAEAFGKNHVQKNMYLSGKPLEFRKSAKSLVIENVLRSIKELGRPTVIRDKTLDELAGGGWLGNKEYPGYLDEDMIVGELLQDSPAMLLEMMIDAVRENDMPAYFDEMFLVGVKQRIDALIECGILASKDGTKSGILTLNLEAVKDTKTGDIDVDYSLATKDSKAGTIAEATSIAGKNERSSYMDENHFEGMKIKETRQGEITEVIYGDDYHTRPAIIHIEDIQGDSVHERSSSYPDDPEYAGSKDERNGFTSNEYAIGRKYERGGMTSYEYSIGSLHEREGELHTAFTLGSIPQNREGYISEEYTLGNPIMRQMYLNDAYSIGTAKSRYAFTSDEYSHGATNIREGLIREEYSIGEAKIRELYINEQYSIAASRPRQGVIDIEYSLAALTLRQISLGEQYSIGTAKNREGYMNEEYSLGSPHRRSSFISDEYSIGDHEAQRSFLDFNFYEGIHEARYGYVRDSTLFAATEARLSFAEQNMLFTDKYAKDSSVLEEGEADKSGHLSLTVEEIFGEKLPEAAHHHEIEGNVVKLRLSQLEHDVLLGIKSAKDSIIDMFLEGIKGGKLSELEENMLSIKLGKNSINFENETLLATKGEKDSQSFESETIYASKGEKAYEITGEALVGIKNVKGSNLHDHLYGDKNVKDSYLHETINTDKEKFGELEENLVADKPQYGYLDPLLPIGGTKVKYGDVPIESVGGTSLKYGDVPIEIVGGTSLKYGDAPIEVVGGTSLKYGGAPIEVVGATSLKYGDIPIEVVSGDKLKYGNIEENLLADKPQYGRFEENFIAFKNAKDSFVHPNLFVYKSVKDSLLHHNAFAAKGVRDSELTTVFVANKGERDSYLHNNIVARKDERDAYLHETIDEVVKLRNSVIEEIQFGSKGIRDSHLEDELVGIQYKNIDLIENLAAFKEVRASYIEDIYTGSKDVRAGSLHEGDSSVVKARSAYLNEEKTFAFNQERQGDLSEEIFGHSLKRIGYVDDELSYGSKTLDNGVVVDDGDTIGKKLTDRGYTSDEYYFASHQSRLGYTDRSYSLSYKEERASHIEREIPTGTGNARLTEIENIDSLMASFEERCAQVIMGFIFAEKEKRGEYLEQLYAFLPERTSHLAEIYHEAKANEASSFHSPDYYHGLRDLSDAHLPEMETMGQGLLYDYSTDLLDHGMNPEDWEGGFGVPEDYDPTDPFNVYYPYSKDMDALELSQTEDWIEFGSGDWEYDKQLGKFYSKSDIATVSGWYRNNFLADKYKFSIDFKVDTDVDGDGAGIIFKYYDENNYWMFMVHGGDSDNSLGMRTTMQLFKVQAGVATAIGSPMQPFKWETDKWYKLSVSVMDGRIQIYTDAKLQYDLTGTD